MKKTAGSTRPDDSISFAFRRGEPRPSRVRLALSSRSRIRQFFYRGVGFGPNQQDKVGDVNPDHKDNEAGEDAVNFGNIRGVLDIEVEADGSQEKRQCNERPANGYPMPSLLYVRQKIVDQVDGDQNQQ